MGRLTAGGAITMSPDAPSPASATAPVNTTTPAGAASLKITASPGVAKLLAGKALVVLKDNLENVLAAGGINPQGATSRVSVWVHACQRAATDPVCKQGLAIFPAFAVTQTGFDASGVAMFNNVPSSGTFYLLADTSNTNHRLWNVRIDLKPGANLITFDERNTTLLQ